MRVFDVAFAAAAFAGARLAESREFFARGDDFASDALMLALNAYIRSTTLFGRVDLGVAIVLPCAFSSRRASTLARCVSW